MSKAVGMGSDQTLAALQKTVTLGSDPPFAAVQAKVRFPALFSCRCALEFRYMQLPLKDEALPKMAACISAQ